MKNTLITSLTACTLIGIGTSHAAIVASDSFETDGTLAGQTGGAGWSGAWTGGNFTVTSGQALAGGWTTSTRLFNGGAITVGTNDVLTISFDLILAETFSGRGVGIQLLDSGEFDYYIGKRQNGGYGLHSDGTTATAGNNLAIFASNPINQNITTVITYDGVNTSFVLSDNNETLSAYTVVGQVTVDGIGLQTLHNSTNGNGFDNLTIDVSAVPEPSSAALVGLGGLSLILRRRK